jgi:tetratricopeptide (TPR) repeat protein
MNSAFRFVLPFAATVIFSITLPGCSKEAKKERALGSAAEFFEKGDYAAAEIEFKNTLKADPGNPEAVKHLGLIRENQGLSYEAAGMLTYAKEKLPKDDLVGVKLAQSMLALGFVQDSRKELLAVLDRTPSDGEALVLLAESSLTPEWMKESEERIKKSGKKTTSTRLASALLELRRGAVEKGEAAVEEVLATDSKSARAHALKASILNSKKQPEAALAELKIAADLAGSRSNESIAYARMLMSLGRRDEAVDYLNLITEKTPDFLPAWAVLGQIAVNDKNDELATKHFMTVLSKNPTDTACAMMQAEVFIRGKQADKAVDVLEKVSAALPSRPQIEFALAKAYLSAGKEAKAAGALDRVLAAAPEYNEAALLRAQMYLAEDKPVEALGMLEAVAKRDPKNAAGRDLLIQTYRKMGRNDDAIGLMRQKLATNNQDADARVELGQLLATLGKFDEARSIFEGVAGISKDSFAAVSNLAIIDFQQGKNDAALARLEEFIVAHPDSAEAYTLKARIELTLKKSEIAEKSLSKAIQLNPKNAAAYAILLQLKSDPGDEAEALTILDAYLKEFPDDPQALLQRGYLLQERGNKDEARAAFSALIKAKPDFAPAYNNLATLEVEAFNDLEAAAGFARKAHALDPSEPAIADTLGWIEWKLGNFAAAMPLLASAAEKLPNNPEVVYHHAMAQYSMGQAAEAAASFKAVIAMEGSAPQKVEAQKYLALIEQSGRATMADLDGLKKRIADNPKDVMAQLQLADLFTRSERYSEALETYQAAFASNPAIPAALVGQARLYAGPLNSPEKALEAATAARELAPRDTQVLAALGSAKLLSGAYEEAYGILKDAAATLETDLAVVYDYARAAYSLGRIQEARTAMAKVASSEVSSAGDAKSFMLLTDSEALKQPDIAAEVEKALARNPQNVSALMLRGSLAAASGKDSEAIYLEILKSMPRFDPARVKLAGIYIEDPAKLDQALTLATEARSRMSDDVELTRIFAIGNYRKGDFRYAAQLLSEVSIKRPLAPDELFVLGMSFANSKQPEKARENLGKAITAGLSEPSATQAKATLAKLDEPKEEK